MTAEFVTMLAGILLSLVFSYMPGAKDWFETLSGTAKRLVMLGLLAVASIGIVAAACAGFGGDLGLSVTCDRAGIVAVVWAFVLAMVANQSTYMLTPKREQ